MFCLNKKKKTEQNRTKNTYVCVKLSDKACEVVVLEESRKKVSWKLWRVPYDEAFVALRTPWDDWIWWGVINHLVRFGEERWEWDSMVTTTLIHLSKLFKKPKIENFQLCNFTSFGSKVDKASNFKKVRERERENSPLFGNETNQTEAS